MSGAPAGGLRCPAPITRHERVQLGHGSGGRMSAELLREHFLPRFDNETLAVLGDAAVVGAGTARLAITTDSFVVSPLEFPGGNIGTLAVHGTLNDLAVSGARPLYLAAAFVLEEGLPFDVLDRILDAMAAAAREAGVAVVTGDTKVVERGKADGVFITTTGIGVMRPGFAPRPDGARPGDVVLLSGPIGRHGVVVLSAREQLGFDAAVTSDTANLFPLVEKLRGALGDRIHALRDPTRGGLATALNEIASASGTGVELDEAALPVPGPVAAACEMLGLDPLYVANEGVFVALLPAPFAEEAVEALRAHPLGRGARVVGRVVEDHPGLVVLRTAIGSSRVVDMLPGDQLPRIC